MGVPAVLLAAAGGMAKNVGANLVAAAASSAAASLFVGIGRETQYAGNRAGPNVRPPVEMLLDLYNRDWIDGTMLRELAKEQGVHFHPDPPNNAADRVWNIVKEASQFEVGINEAISLRRQGLINQEQYRAILTNNGVYYNVKVSLLEKLSDPIPADLVMSLYRQGSLPDEAACRYWLKAAGITNPQVQDAYLNVSRPITPENAFVLNARGARPFSHLEVVMGQAGIIEPEDRADFLDSQEWIPSPSDLVQFAVREVWAQDVVDKFGYDEEFDSIPEFSWWMNVVSGKGNPNPRQNGSNPFIRKRPDGAIEYPGDEGEYIGSLKSWAQAFWRAHWQLPSPTQAYEFLHRLRPDRIGRYRELVPGVNPFTFADMQLLLKTADYPKPFRDMLAAVSYRTVTRVDLRRLYELDVITREEVYQYNLDYGYVPEDARRITEYVAKDKDRRKYKKYRDSESKRQVRLYKLGVIDGDTFKYRYILLGNSADEADVELAVTKADIAEQRIALAQRNLKNLYAKWEIDGEEAKARLRTLGMVEQAVLDVVETWKLEREGKGRHVTASQIVRWVVRGVITAGNAVKRLVAMGYSRHDAILLVRVARQDEAVLAARAAKAVATSTKAVNRAAEAEVRAMEIQLAKMRRRLATGGSPALLRRWLKKGLVDASEVFRRLVALGWTEVDANRLVQEVTSADAPNYTPSNLEQEQEPQ